VQWTAILAGRQFAIGLARLPQRFVRRHRDERVQAAIVGLDALQALLGHAYRRQLARTKAAAEFFDGDHRLPLASSLKSAERSAWAERASASSRGFRSGRPRFSASAMAACSQDAMVMCSLWSG
jgi:hypothetical protein